MKKTYLHYGLISILIMCVSALFISCSEGPVEGEGTGVGQTASIALEADPTSITADGFTSSTITATLIDSAGGAVSTGTAVTFSTTLGTFANDTTSYTMTTADESGTAVTSLIAGTTQGTATATAESNGVTQSVYVEFTGATVAGSDSILSLALSQTSVKSDNSDSATITATLVDVNNAALSGITVAFSSSGGQLSASSADTDDNGQAQVTFSSGTIDKSNRVATVTATVPAVQPRQIPIQITGTTITLSTDNTNLEIGGVATDTLTITVKDAGAVPIYDAPVTLSVSTTGIVTLFPDTGNTDVNGTLDVDVTGIGSGSVTVTVDSMGATATQTYEVGTTGLVFGITLPTDDPHSLATNSDLTITVSAPGVAQVQFATTLGGLTGTNPAATGQVITQTVSAGSASAVLNSPNAGIATVQVFNPSNPSTTDSLKVAISAPSSEAFQIALQASATVVAPSTGGVSNSVTLTATVKNVTEEPVGSSPVAFSIVNPTGGGETISPVIVYTDSYGRAASTFTSGSMSSDAQGVTVKASVVGTAIEDTIAIVIGGTAGSVTIGLGTTITGINNETAYQSPMSVLVSDSNGNPVSGAQVSLGLWPTQYATGFWVEDPVSGKCTATVTGTFNNEDTNRNLILDPGEDIGPGAPDGELTPPSSAAGSVRATVTTDENGVANFNLVYLKASAAWIEAEVSATTLVLGTETQSTYTFWLGWKVGEECNLPHSPYGP
jgi:hypothetical protein